MKVKIRPLLILTATRWDVHGDHPLVEKRAGATDDGELAEEIGWIDDDAVYPGDWIVESEAGYMLVRADKFVMDFEIIEETISAEG